MVTTQLMLSFGILSVRPTKLTSMISIRHLSAGEAKNATFLGNLVMSISFVKVFKLWNQNVYDTIRWITIKVIIKSTKKMIVFARQHKESTINETSSVRNWQKDIPNCIQSLYFSKLSLPIHFLKTNFVI